MPGSFHDTSIIVACRNEEEMIEGCLALLTVALPGAEIIVVVGGTDDTLARAERFARRWPCVIPIKNDPDYGKGHAVQRGIAEASGKYMAQFDADLQFFADDLPRLLEPIRTGRVDVTFGSRFLPNSDRDAYKPIFYRDFGNRLLAAHVSMLIGRRVTDVTAGVKAWTREAIQKIDFRDQKYSYEAEIVVRTARLGLRFEEVPVRYADRTKGDSMHRNTLALAKAGAVIAGKALATRFRAV